jgi:hypothetical protein
MLTDGFALGHRSGVVCNSDGHKGRPGASYPGASTFGAFGGLTCFLTDDLSRDGIFECLRRRHHYGTTGCRMHMDIAVKFNKDSKVFERDPKVFPESKTFSSSQVMMGDIVQTSEREALLKMHVLAHSPIERIEVRNGTDLLETFRPYKPNDLGHRIRVIWSGAEYRGRGRQSTWTGLAVFKECRIEKLAKINAWNHERRLDMSSKNTVEWDAITTGNFGGFDVWLEEGDDAELKLTCNRGEIQAPLNSIGFEDTVLNAGGLERRLRVFRLPPENPHREVQHQLLIPLNPNEDNPLWICVTTEDGFQAWSSPVFVFN